MKILSWNIQQGGGSRTVQVYKSIIQYNPSIIVLSEFKNNKNGLLIRKALLDYGYLHQITSGAQENENSVLIASKLPCHSQAYFHLDLDYKHNILKADFGLFSVIGVYLPHKKRHKLFNILQSEAEQNQPLIIMGDYNCGINFVDQKGDSFWYTSELKRLSKVGYVDAYRLLHGSVESYSWYSHQGNGYRYDHCYIHEDLSPIVDDCFYLHTWREEKLSDHSPMILKLKA